MRQILERILVGSGNQSVFAASKPVFTATGLNPAIKVNQFVIYDPILNRSLGPGATITTNPIIVVAQAIDTNGDGMADELRKPFGEKLVGTAINSWHADPAELGMSKIVDVTFDCTDVETIYSLIVKIKDDETTNLYPYNRTEDSVGYYEAKSATCDTCDNNLDPKQVSCGLAKSFKPDPTTLDPRKNSSLLRRAMQQKLKDSKFDVYPLFENDSTYCITIDAAADCEGCTLMTGIKAISVDAVVTELDQSLDETATTKSVLARLEYIVKQMNDALDGKGSAVVSRALVGNAAPCAAFSILINSCVDVLLLDSEDEEIVPCSGPESPFVASVTDGACEGCDTPTTTTPTAGLRFVAKPVEITKFGDIINVPVGDLWRDLDVFVGPHGTNFKSFRKRVVQDFVIPNGLGYQWWKRIIAQNNTGTGFGYDPFMSDAVGLFGMPRTGTVPTDAVKGLSINGTYIIYSINHFLPATAIGVQGEKFGPKGTTYILVETGDSVTRTELEAILNPWMISAGKSAVSGTTQSYETEQVVNAGTGLVTTNQYPNINNGNPAI